MNEKVLKLCNSITPEQFEAIMLLYETSEEGFLIGCDIGEPNNQKYYKFIDRNNDKKYILIIWFNDGLPDFESISKKYPDCDSIGLSDYGDISFMPYNLKWLCEQPKIPGFLENIRDEAQKIIDLLEKEIY